MPIINVVLFDLLNILDSERELMELRDLLPAGPGLPEPRALFGSSPIDIAAAWNIRKLLLS